MKAFHGKAVIGYTVEVEDNATPEEIKEKLASGMGWYYFSNFYSEDVFDVEEVSWEEWFGQSDDEEEEEEDE